MTPREKILSIGVGVALAAAVGSYVFKSVRTGFQKKNDQISRLTR